jgi:hypothetical protein
VLNRIEEVHFTQDSRWLLCGGFGCTMATLAFIGNHGDCFLLIRKDYCIIVAMASY